MTRAADLAKLIAGGGTITVADNSENLKLVTTDADANVGPTLRMDRQSASAADGDLLGKVNFVGHNDAGTPEDIEYAGITVIISDASDGTEDGKLAINTMVAGTERSRIFVDADETVFNEDSIDVDFRVESDDNTNALFVEGSTGNVGIGTSSLNVSGNDTNFTSLSIIETVGNRSGILEIGDNQDQDTGGIGSINFVGHYQDANHKIMAQFSAFSDGSTSGQRGSTVTIRTKANGSTTLSEAMRIDSDGHVGIGTTDPQVGLQVEASDGSVNGTIRLTATGVASAGMAMDANGLNFGADTGGFVFKTSATANDPSDTGTERMRIDSAGLVLIGHTAQSTSEDVIVLHSNAGSTGHNIQLNRDATSTKNQIAFSNPNGQVGTIQTAGSGTAYNTSSDYRLKENVTTSWDATTRLKQLKPSRFNFKADKDTTLDGFLAHEVTDIVPQAVSGEKDAVDKDGNIEAQGIDHSKLVPLMVKTIQELEARIATLESK